MLASLMLMAVGAVGTVDVWLVRDQDTEPCDKSCWQSLERHARAKPGVRKVELHDDGARLVVSAQGLKIAHLLSGLNGFKAEMRAPYADAEVQLDPDAFFPPILRTETDALILPLGPEVKKAIEQSADVILQQRMKCVGNLRTPVSGEVMLWRFAQDGLPPNAYLSFAAMPDFDGDGKPDLYMRLTGLPEIIVMGRPGNLHLFTIGSRNPDELIRCDMTPDRFVRVVKHKNIRCVDSGERARGDAVEKVIWNQSSELLFYNGTRFVTCVPKSAGPEVEEGFEKADKGVKVFKRGQEAKP
jgi:hypothetical protein